MFEESVKSWSYKWDCKWIKIYENLSTEYKNWIIKELALSDFEQTLLGIKWTAAHRPYLDGTIFTIKYPQKLYPDTLN